MSDTVESKRLSTDELEGISGGVTAQPAQQVVINAGKPLLFDTHSSGSEANLTTGSTLHVDSSHVTTQGGKEPNPGFGTTADGQYYGNDVGKHIEEVHYKSQNITKDSVIKAESQDHNYDPRTGEKWSDADLQRIKEGTLVLIDDKPQVGTFSAVKIHSDTGPSVASQNTLVGKTTTSSPAAAASY